MELNIFAITFVTVTRFTMLPTDRTWVAGFAIWEQRDHFATFEIADDCPVTLVTSLGQSSIPTTVEASKSGVLRLRTRRRGVSLLTGN